MSQSQHCRVGNDQGIKWVSVISPEKLICGALVSSLDSTRLTRTKGKFYRKIRRQRRTDIKEAVVRHTTHAEA